jgi:hypothetical protein
LTRNYWQKLPAKPVSAWFQETAQFSDWKPYTNPTTGKSGWISDGGQVRYDDPRKAVAEESHASAAAEHFTAGLADRLPKGVWDRVKGAALTAAARVYLTALKADPVIQKMMAAAGAILDTPADMQRLGYHPGVSSGTAHAPAVQDALRNSLGISTHLATTIGSHILARAITWLRSRAQTMADVGGIDEAARELAKLYDAVDEALGLPAANDPAQVAAALRSIEPVKMADDTHKFGWVGAMVPEPLASQLVSLGEQIPAADLAGDGLEDEPHVTILYGLHDIDPAAVREAMAGQGPFTIALTRATPFPSQGEGAPDVVKMDAESPILHELNVKLRELPHTSDYPDYNPHATIGYTVAGTGAAHAETIGQVNQSFTVNELVYKDKDGNATVIPLAPAREMADEPPTVGRPVTAKTAGGKPASDEVSIAGKEGREVVSLLRASKAEGVKTFSAIVGEALKRFDGTGELLNHDELARLSEALAAVNGTAELLGRARVRELVARADAAHKFADRPLAKFADTPPGIIATPEGAYQYFAGLVPKLGVDPERFAGEQRRQAFTLAKSANQFLTDKVKQRILQGLATAEGAADVTAGITSLLEAAGVSPSNPQYAEMVFRTNAMDSYQTGVYEEGRHSDVASYFPVWQYIGINDERAGHDHRPRFNRYYPATATFAEVRGNRPFNCRCSLRWVDKFEWAELQAKGVKAETEWHPIVA